MPYPTLSAPRLAAKMSKNTVVENMNEADFMTLGRWLMGNTKDMEVRTAPRRHNSPWLGPAAPARHDAVLTSPAAARVGRS